MPETLANGASSTLNGAITNSQTTLTIQSADTGKFPSSGTYRLAVTDNTNTELMTVTGGQGTATLTVTRHSEAYAGASTAFAFASGSTVAQVLTYAGLTALVPVKYAEVVLSSTAASVSFSSIPQTYRNMRLVWDARSDLAAVGQIELLMQFNGDTTANYEWAFFYGLIASVSGGRNNSDTGMRFGYATAATATSGDSAAGETQIVNYAATTFRKKILSHSYLPASAQSNPEIDVWGGSWKSTAAITSITITPRTASNFLAGSSFSLYLEP